ncbi:MAG: hypothetical protein DRJ15_17880 [Bacteroidetes bacterium]|nr:MAG: hypothetical protein DRJ15_17880 [Bacteroidota bacterium]
MEVNEIMRIQEIKKQIGKERTKEFLEWMRGQTVGIYSDGETDYYTWDFERFVEGRSPMW